MSRRPLRSLLTANTISTVGTTMTLLAIPWYVLQTTGSASRTGIAAASETIPLALAAGLGGPFVDRLGARRVSVIADVVSALAIAAIPVLDTTVGLAFWQLCLLIGVVGLARGPGDTSRHVLVPGLAKLGETPLERATSLYDGVSRGARMLGAPLAGVLIAIWGASNILLIDAATFAASALLVQLMVPSSVRPAVAVEDPEPYLEQLRSGMRYVRRDRLIAGITSMVMVTNLLDAAFGSVLMPVFARDVLHSSVALGLLGGIFGGGALVGTIVYGVIGPRLPRWPVYTVAFFIVGGPRFFLLGAEPPLLVILAGTLVAGLVCGAINPVLSAVEFQRIPEAMQSRVFGATAAGCFIGMPVGTVGGGILVDVFGIRAALFVTGGLYLVTTLAPLVFPVWREMDAGRDVRRRVQPQKNAVAQIP